MICFGTIDKDTFLTDYWQKKPLLIRQALPGFVNPLTADELAGLALEEGVESRMAYYENGLQLFVNGIVMACRLNWLVRP